MSKIGKYDVHEFANLFPLIQGEEYNSLVKDVKENGLLESIWLHEGKVLDGRNRLRVCLETGVTPSFRHYDGDSPLQFVISLNLKRRHLNASQRAALAVDILPLLEKEAKDRQGTRTDLVGKIPQGDEGKSRDKASEVFNVDASYISAAKKIKEETPEDYKAIRTGDKTISEVVKERKQKEHQKKIDEQKQKIKEDNLDQPKGNYDVIVIDPPWEAGSYSPDHYMGRTANPYPEMSIDQIKKLQLPAKNDCVLWLWTTNSKLRYVWDILDAWGFEYKSILTWNKESIGVGHWLRNVTEHCILAIKGKPVWTNKIHSTLISEKRTQHSKKPECFYNVVDDICVGRKLDYFARKKREGWDAFGDEVKE